MAFSATDKSSMRDRPGYLTIHENLRHHVSARPDKLAVVQPNRTLTYAQLYESACRIAHGLKQQKIGQGDHVGIYLRNDWSYIAIYYALSMSGAVAVPINYMLRSDQVATLLEQTSCRLLFAERSLREEVHRMRSCSASSIPVCYVDESTDDSALSLQEWLANDDPVSEPGTFVDVHDTMMILFSSGTTGLPKGIRLSHLNRVLYFFELGMEYGIRYNDVNLCSTPLYHNAAIFFAFNNLYFGATTVIHRKFDVLRTFEDIATHRATNAFFVPTQLHQLIQSNESHNFDLSSLRVIVSGAAPLATATKEAIFRVFPDIELHELYGLTETGLITNLRPEDQLRKIRCAGQAFLNMEFRVVDPQGQDLPVGNVGEIITRGPTLCNGYYANETATRQAWQDGWFHTGDLGRTDEEGFLYIVDRLKDMILSGGVNIYPKDIEEVIYTLPAVRDVAVVGIPDEKWGEAVHALVVSRDEQQLSEQQILDVCKEKLPNFQVPRSVEFRDELPRNPSGKLLKTVIRKEFWGDNNVKV